MDDAESKASAWQPANPMEEALRRALERGDQERYCAVLAEAVLLVPVVEDSGSELPVLAAAQLEDGEVVIPAFTSPEARVWSEATGGLEVDQPGAQWVPVPFTQLVLTWPDPRWRLGVNPGLPVATHLSGVELPAVVTLVFAPTNDTERELSQAREPAEVLAVLTAAELHLPVREKVPFPPDLGAADFPWWRWEPGGEAPTTVPVFTSRQRMRGCLGLAHPRVESVVVELLALAEHWPDPQWALAVNPGTPYAVTFLGEQVVRLAERLPGALARQMRLQVLVPPDSVPAYLDDGYGTVAGMVHASPGEPVPLKELYEGLGLLRGGSPFAAADESAFVIRWQPEPEVAERWVRDPRPRTESVHVPAGAQLVELRAGGDERLVATYHPDHHEWTRSG